MSATADHPSRGRFIGRGLPRPGAKRLLSGRGRYTDDVVLPRMLHAAFLRSPYAHARLGAIDVSEAARMPGVHRVLTGADFAAVCSPWTGTLSHFKGMRSPPQWPLPTRKVVWAGQPLVMVVAESRAEAEDALEVIGVEFEELAAVVDPEGARAPNSPRIDEDAPDNVLFRTRVESGSTAEVFEREASVVVDLRFGRHTAVTMEPRSVLADFDPGEERLTVHQSTQTPYQFQDLYARHFDLPEARVRVIAPDVGGSFGMKLHLYHEDMAVVGASPSSSAR